MKIVFIYNGTESLGIEHISSLIKSKGHEVVLLFDPAVFQGEIFINIESLAKRYDMSGAIIKKAIELKPDLIAFSSFTGNYRWCLNITHAIKNISNIPIVFGGVHPTAVPEKVLSNDFIDFVIVGEGEFAMLDLIEHLFQGKPINELFDVPNICFKHENRIYLNSPRPYIRDLDSLPFPDKQLFFDQEPFFRKNPYLIMTSRGCPYNCNYCSNNMFRNLYSCEKQSVRRRSPDNVIEELLMSKKRWDIKRVYFMDDVFTFSTPWLREFIEKYIQKIKLPFYCYVHPLSLTREAAFLLKKGGCYLVGMGVQSGSERIRKDIYNRLDSNDKIIEAMSYLKENKINVQVDHIFGAPSENEEDLKESMQLYRKLKPEMILTFWLTYYPKTKIIEIAKRFGTLSDKDVNDIESGYIGYTHSTGSVAKDKVSLFNKYELNFEILALCHNNILYALLLKAVPFIPFKKMMSNSIYAVTGLIYNRNYIFNKFSYAFRKLLDKPIINYNNTNMEENKKLNLGCGQFYKDGYINLDVNSKTKADVFH
ncbi:MAG: radical SAM protein, partial [bacterium]